MRRLSAAAAMPSRLHEVLVDLFRERPALVVPLLAAGGFSIADGLEARASDTSFAALIAEYRADATVLLADARGKLRLVVIVEIQLAPDGEKKTTWPIYEVLARARHRTDACVLVVAPHPRVAAWAEREIRIGPSGSRFVPIVLGPGTIPAIVRAEDACAMPELALLSAVAHADEGDHGASVALAALEAFAHLDETRAGPYLDVLLGAVADETRRRLEAMMQTKYEYQSDYMRRLEAKAKAEGKAEALRDFLAARGLVPTAEQSARIAECRDIEQLRRWSTRAATATHIDEVFAEG